MSMVAPTLISSHAANVNGAALTINPTAKQIGFVPIAVPAATTKEKPTHDLPRRY